MGLEGREREPADPRELAKRKERDEAVPDHSKIGLLAPALHDRASLGALTLLEIVCKRDATNDIKRRSRGPVEHIDVTDAGVGFNLRLKTSDDIVNCEPHVWTHSANAIERKGGSDECAHGLVKMLGLDPNQTTPSEALNDGSKHGRVRVVVCVLQRASEAMSKVWEIVRPCKEFGQ